MIWSGNAHPRGVSLLKEGEGTQTASKLCSWESPPETCSLQNFTSLQAAISECTGWLDNTQFFP